MMDSGTGGPQIPPVGDGRQYPLSFQQQTTWLVGMHRPDALLSPLHIIYLVLRLKGPLRYEVLQSAFDDLIERQGALRTRLAVAADEDVIQEELSGVCQRVELSEGAVGEEELPELLRRMAGTPIPMGTPPLARVWVHRLGPDEHLLFLGLHHMACDATGLYTAMEDLVRAYEARLEGRRLPPLPLSPGEYALWQAKTYAGRLERDGSFWPQYAEGLQPYEVRSDLPFQPGVQGVKSHGLRLPLLGEEESKALERFATRRRASTFVTLLAGFHVALGSRTMSEDRLSITLFDQRDHPDTREMVGYFLCPTPLRTPLRRDVPLAETLPAMTRNVLAAYQRAYMPAPYYLSAFSSAVGGMLGEVAPWAFILQHEPRSGPFEYRFGEARGHILHAGANTQEGPGMALRTRRTYGDGLLLHIGYDPGLWREDSMRALGERYTRALRAMVEDPSRTPAQLLELIGSW